MTGECACGCGTVVAGKFKRGHNKRVSVLSRLEARTTITPSCWIWNGPLSHKGYGRITVGKRLLAVHRVSYEIRVGSIPDGLPLDHICHTADLDNCKGGDSCPHRRCVNPAHLRPTTTMVNVLTGLGPPAINAAKTHCKRGHEFAGPNLINRSDGKRQCRTCENMRQRNRRASRAALTRGVAA